MPFAVFGQTYSALWKKAKEAEDKDLPKTQYEVLQQIVKKATKEKAYGQLLKAELEGAATSTGSLDSQRHPGKFPKVPCRRRGKRGFPAAPRQRTRESFFNASRGPSPLP